MKMSCCGKCSNSACVDYGECDCFEEMMQQQLDLLRKSLEDGTYPTNLIDVEEF